MGVLGSKLNPSIFGVINVHGYCACLVCNGFFRCVSMSSVYGASFTGACDVE